MDRGLVEAEQRGDRVAALGARIAWVDSDLPLDGALGFMPRYRSPLWARSLAAGG